MARILLITEDVNRAFEISKHHSVSLVRSIEGARELISFNKLLETEPKQYEFILFDEELINKKDPEVEEAIREFQKAGAKVEFINKQTPDSLIAL